MRLRNKKTGETPDEIKTIAYIQWSGKIMMVYRKSNGGRIMKYYDSLEDFNAEWEDAPEEPKEYWYIDEEGDISSFEYTGNDCDKRMQTIGNFFETKEEAEKAVEKLKAWKRLKDKGLKIHLQSSKGYSYLEANWGVLEGDYSDVRLLFGGEE